VSILSGRDKDGYVPVRSVGYYRHVRRAASLTENPVPTLRVTYTCGVATVVNEWLCFSHKIGSMPHRKAVSWWMQAGGTMPPPKSVEEAIERQGELSTPESIRYRKGESGFNEITGRRYSSREQVA
jgi:DNA repair protein RadD